MKKLLFLFLLLPLLSMPSCVKEEDDLFGASAAERMTQALKDYNAILNGAPNGWLMEYYSGDAGGFVYLCRFETLEGELSGDVTVASDLDITETVTSLYELKQDQSAVLTFNTYNAFLHYFAEPYDGNRVGLSGDYEFTFMKASADSVVLRGKKHGDRIVMTPFRGNDWQEYLQSLLAMQDQCSYGAFKLYAEGELVCPAEMDDYRWIRFYLGNTVIEQRFIYTLTGVKLYEPTKVGAVVYEYLDWDNAGMQFKCVGVDRGELKTVIPEDYLLFAAYAGEWDFIYSTTATSPTRHTRPVTLVADGRTYRLEGLWADHPDRFLTLGYEKATGRLTLAPQIIDVSGDNYINFAALVVGEGSLWFGIHPKGQIGVWDMADRNNPRIEWIDAGYFPDPICGWILWLLDAQGNNAGQYMDELATDRRFVDIEMIKK
ncbi:MAG: DUF4302 domain-containing protein [Bacteroidales bacterium]|jgi:hypothetical protein|nr:DUF4302 domain-containing protein [Bacteroidales bacterium]